MEAKLVCRGNSRTARAVTRRNPEGEGADPKCVGFAGTVSMCVPFARSSQKEADRIELELKTIAQSSYGWTVWNPSPLEEEPVVLRDEPSRWVVLARAFNPSTQKA